MEKKAKSQERPIEIGEEPAIRYPKGRLYQRMGISAKVFISICRVYGFRLSPDKTLDTTALLADIFAFLIKHSKDLPPFLARKERSKRLKETGDAEDADYDHYDARRVRAIALLKEFELDRKKSEWVPVEVLQGVLRSALDGHVRGMIDDYDKRDTLSGPEVSARLRRMLTEISEEVEREIDVDGSSERNTESVT